MKKTFKKQKIIILIAIALIIVIIGILIGTNAIKVNILTGKFNSANNGSSNGNLLPEYIKAGITLGGVTGTLEDLDTSDATATAEDIALGKTAYVNGVKITGTRAEPISQTDSYVGYYADIEGDGTVDGIIYADVAVGNTGDGQWTNSNGNYTIPTKTNLKDYYIIQEEYTDDFGTKPVIAPLNDSSKEDRFYVMALEDFDSSSHYWYKNAYGNMSDYSTATSGDFGKGKENTDAMIKKWNLADNGGYGAQDANDMWGLIQEKVKDGWFVPSRGEWSAFAEELKITNKNYVNYKLSDWYWSSSQYITYYAYGANFRYGFVYSTGNVNDFSCVRLSTTF